ncbi:geranylgeranylglyceryl/heptaprenylglyceryl phosphate synthase [Thermogymnomonas acidicola]|uniref:Geranylgeranylglyceryl phosphate synthase n=1 Tax=Thermogymnomonas acidicola TaxID=399579 RepID=A0AA37BRL8_9ARCH|nr:geranylgeranylglyceryl/heptaprenylglyceryl phosphate synthase [Thermogymnomonas acidicola]GGM74938.1 geranylgeranylglyceryl/heptaprenylglyceryl phosphate synthase [Thermogymnomonas acidicola]
MNVYASILEKLREEKVHMTLIDPASQTPDRAGKIAEEAEAAGTDFIMVGGSTNIDGHMLDRTIESIRDSCTRKIIIFPGSSNMVSDRADAIYYLSLMNSEDPEFIVGHQVRAARYLRALGLEVIPMGYLVFEPGMTVGKVGKARLIGREDHILASSFALSAQLFGMKLVYFESGSGSPTTVSPKVVSETKALISVPLIVGGGIRDRETAQAITRAGADIIVTGTLAERSQDVYASLHPIISGVKGIPVQK